MIAFLLALYYLFLLSGIFIYRLKGNLVLLIFSLIQCFYIFLIPFTSYVNGNYTSFIAFDVFLDKSDFDDFFWLLLLHNLFLLSGYFLFWTISNMSTPIPKSEISIGRFNVVSAFLIFLLIYDMSSGEINFFAILTESTGETDTMGFKGRSFWFAQIADSIIIISLFYIYIIGFRLRSLFIFTLSLGLFLILGFRYRIILFILGFFLMYTRKFNFNVKMKLRIVLIACISFYILMFSTANRYIFISQNWGQIEYNVFNYNYDDITANSLGGIVDISLLKAVNMRFISCDMGYTIFLTPVHMMLPAGCFENGKKPYPPPQLTNIDRSLGVEREYGQACSYLGMIINAFGPIAVIFFGLFFGIGLRKLEVSYKSDWIRNLPIILAGFQLLTRGYMGSFLLTFAYLKLPLLLAKIKLLRNEGKA